MSQIDGMNEQLNAAKAGFAESVGNLDAARVSALTVEERLVAVGALVRQAMGLMPSYGQHTGGTPIDEVIVPMQAAQQKLPESVAILGAAAEESDDPSLQEAVTDGARAVNWAVEGGIKGPVPTPEELHAGIEGIYNALYDARKLITKVAIHGYRHTGECLGAAKIAADQTVVDITAYQIKKGLSP